MCVCVCVCVCVCDKMATGPDVMTSSVCDADGTMGGSHVAREPDGRSMAVSWLDRSKMAPSSGRRLSLTHFCEKHTCLMADKERQSKALSDVI